MSWLSKPWSWLGKLWSLLPFGRRGRRGRLAAIGRDLTNLEVNTILSSGGMMGQKMPEYPRALHDIIRTYLRFLTEDLNVDLKAYVLSTAAEAEAAGAPDEPPGAIGFSPGAQKPEDPRTTAALFRQLAWAAHLAYRAAVNNESGTEKIGPRELPRLRRIELNAEVLADIVTDLNEAKDFLGLTLKETKDKLKKSGDDLPPANADQLTHIRKIWELGVDEIVMQSVVQLDGDIVFRAARSVDLQRDAALLEAHRRATDVGLKHWQALYELVFTLLSKGIGRLLNMF